MSKDVSGIVKQVDASAIGKHHNEALGRLLDRQSRLRGIDDYVKETLAYIQDAGLAPPAACEVFGISIRTLTATRALSLPLHELGFSRDLTAYLQGYAMVARPPRTPVRNVKPSLSRLLARLNSVERLASDVFTGVFDASADFWFERLKEKATDDPKPSAMVIPTGSHTGIDLGKLALADASGAVGALAGAGMLGLLGVTTVAGPLTPAGLAGYLAAAGAIASFLFYLGGGADVIYDREPLVPAPSPGGGGDRPIS